MKKIMNKKQIIVTICCVAVLMGAVYTILSARGEVEEAFGYLQNADWLILLLLIPTICLTWRTAGGIWRPYLEDDGLSVGLLSRIQYEINFVDTVVPFLNVVPGAAYALTRLKKLGVSEGKASGMMIFRYIISISTKWIEIAFAMIILTVMGKTGEMPTWVVCAICVMILAVIVGFATGMVCYQRKIRVPRKLARSQKYGKAAAMVQEQLDNLFQTLDIVFSRKKALGESIFYGLLYSLLEVYPFWIVASAMGHSELLLQIIVASGIAITVGIIIPTPMGIGGFDGAMILFLGSMGSSVALVSAIVITTRVLILTTTAITGIPFWIHGMKCINDKS